MIEGRVHKQEYQFLWLFERCVSLEDLLCANEEGPCSLTLNLANSKILSLTAWIYFTFTYILS